MEIKHSLIYPYKGLCGMGDYLQHGYYNSSLCMHDPGLGHMTFLDQENEAEVMACEPVLTSLSAPVLAFSETSHPLTLTSWSHG